MKRKSVKIKRKYIEVDDDVATQLKYLAQIFSVDENCIVALLVNADKVRRDNGDILSRMVTNAWKKKT